MSVSAQDNVSSEQFGPPRGYLFHGTDAKNLRKIQREGLRPRDPGYSNGTGVYLTNSTVNASDYGDVTLQVDPPQGHVHADEVLHFPGMVYSTMPVPPERIWVYNHRLDTIDLDHLPKGKTVRSYVNDDLFTSGVGSDGYKEWAAGGGRWEGEVKDVYGENGLAPEGWLRHRRRA